jgi:hypothetical protein
MKRRKPGNRHLRTCCRLREIVVRAGVPASRIDGYTDFAIEFHAIIRRKLAPEYDAGIRSLVMKYFRRGFSGHLLWRVGSALMDWHFRSRKERT